MKLAVITVLAALALALVACEEKKDGAVKPAATGAAAAPANEAAPGASAKAASSGGGW
jgi:hypothetical protein